MVTDELLQLIKFVQARESFRAKKSYIYEGSIILPLIKEHGEQAVEAACMDLLGWLKTNPVLSKRRGLEVSKKWARSAALSSLLNNSSELSKIFLIGEESLNFTPAVDRGTRDEIEMFVNDNYHPLVVP